MFPIGSEVKYTAAYLLPDRDRWQSCGNSMKESYRKHYETKKALIGVVLESTNKATKIKWNNGTESEIISNYIELVK